MLKAAVILVIFLVNHRTVVGFSSGPPTSVCGSFLPQGHPGRGQSSRSLNYVLTPEVAAFYPGQIVRSK